MTPADPEATVVAFIRAFERGDLVALAGLLDERFRGYVTTAEGGVREVDRAGYVAAVEAMDVGSANLRIDIPNVVTVEPNRILVMVEVHATRHGRSLHNFSAQLGSVEAGRLVELWMVEALPAASDAFWSAEQ